MGRARSLSRSRLGRGALLGLALLLAACGQTELYSKLSEAQANEMIAVLQGAGIDASKEDKGEQGWTLSASSGDFSHAIAVLHTQGYPRDEFASLGTMFKKEGFVSSPTEEHSRLVYGMNQELSHTLSEIDGVVQARVQLVLPEKEPLAQDVPPPSASVFLKYRPGANIDAQVGKVKSLVANSVQGLKYENVSVATFAAQPLPVIHSSEGSRLGTLLSAAIPALLVILGALFAYPRFRRWQQRRRTAGRMRDLAVAEPREGDA